MEGADWLPWLTCSNGNHRLHRGEQALLGGEKGSHKYRANVEPLTSQSALMVIVAFHTASARWFPQSQGLSTICVGVYEGLSAALCFTSAASASAVSFHLHSSQ